MLKQTDIWECPPSSLVSLQPVPDYDPDRVFEAIRQCLAPLGGMEAVVRPGQRVLLKPNLLGAFPASRAVTTHPAVVRAVIKLVQEADGQVWIGDSPGMGDLRRVVEVCGLAPVVAETGARLLDFGVAHEFEVPDYAVVPRLVLTQALCEVDVIITLPKLKTHAQMTLTGALKNQYGLIPGTLKSHWHFRMQQPEWLASLILDIHRVARPSLVIMDAVTAMEGKGPSAGNPRQVGVILAGRDLAAVDTVACHLIGLNPMRVPLLTAARQQEFGTTSIEQIQLAGPDWRTLAVPDFKKVEHVVDLLRLLPLPASLLRGIRWHWTARPRIRAGECTRCGVCVNHCPVKPAAIHPELPVPQQVDDQRCICCYCCHELCPSHAIDLRESWLKRHLPLETLANRLSDFVAGLVSFGKRFRTPWLLTFLAGWIGGSTLDSAEITAAPQRLDMKAMETQITRGPGGRILTHTGVWSPDSEWIVYDTRSDASGTVFDGTRIEMVNIRTGEVRSLYTSQHGACCGVTTFHPRESKVIFILGPENPTPDWSYNAWHRQGVIVDTRHAGTVIHLDARDLTPPFTAGALRGGSHVHVWDGSGEWVSFTYEDHVLAAAAGTESGREPNQRNVGVSVPGHPVKVSGEHPRNHDGEYFSVLVTRTVAEPRPGSDEIRRACEEAWIGSKGYVRTDGSRQGRALAFQGEIELPQGGSAIEVYLVDLPDDLTKPGEKPLAGTETRRPYPPRGVVQRRLTHTADRPYPGIQGPRHWLRSSPDGSRIGCLMKDDSGIVQLWTVNPARGELAQLTRNPWPIGSAFTWSPTGRHLAHIMDGSVCITSVENGQTVRLTPRRDEATAPRPEACVFSPDGLKIAYVRRVPSPTENHNQIFVVTLAGQNP